MGTEEHGAHTANKRHTGATGSTSATGATSATNNPRGHNPDFFRRLATECTDEMICTVDHGQMKTVWDQCKKDMGGHDEFRKVYENFCICLRKAYGKTAQQLPCIVPNVEQQIETKANNEQDDEGEAEVEENKRE